MREILKRLVETPGGNGFEERVIELIFTELKKYISDVSIDSMGNIVGKIPGSGKESAMVCVHSDEVGMLVKYIDPRGYIYFDLNGMLDERVFFSTRVDICAESGTFEGVIGIKSRHLLSPEELKRPVNVGDLWIDVGAERGEEVRSWGIQIGDPIVFHHNFTSIGGNTIISKAIDNRVGCAILIHTAERFKSKKLDYTLFLTAAVQEEIGSRGARVIAQTLQPDMAIVIDTVPATDPATPPQQATDECGKGPVIRSMDVASNGQGTIYSKKICQRIIAVAEKHGVPYQRDIFRTWTDASTIHTAGKGIPTGGIYIPRRYSHSPTELIKWSDIENSANLLMHFLEELDSIQIKELTRKI